MRALRVALVALALSAVGLMLAAGGTGQETSPLCHNTVGCVEVSP